MGNDKDTAKSADADVISQPATEGQTKPNGKDGGSASDSSDSEPEGGYDSTQLSPSKDETYVVRIVFLSGTNMPIADVGQLSSDPYVLAQLSADGDGRYGKRHKTDPFLRFRSATAHSTTEPRWEAEWVVAGVPKTGFVLTARVYDEDTGTKDDRLGKIALRSGELEDGWSSDTRDFKLKKRGASTRAWGLHAVRKLHPANRDKDPALSISAEVLGKTEDECGKIYSLTSWWFTHYSPLIGTILGTTSTQEGVEKANFQANELNLRGPVPNELYHRYVEFKSFIKAMFEERGIHGAMMGGAMRKQHRRVYHFDGTTEYGRLPGPGRSMAQRFLDMTHWGEGFRIFTYIITLDGLIRFTETGKEFGIDMLSKHAMHSEIDNYIAYSGEFYVRKYRSGSGEAAAGTSNDSTSESGTLDYDAPSHSMLRPPKDADDTDGVVETHDHNLVFRKKRKGKKGKNDAGGGGAHPAAAEPASSQAGDSAPDMGRLSLAPANGGPGTMSQPQSTGAHDNGNPPHVSQEPKAPDGSEPTAEAKEKRDTSRPVETLHLHGGEETESLDPSAYELVIDNDSGTYRPNKDLLPLLRAFLASNFVGLHVTVKAADDDAHQEAKKKRHAERNEATGGVRYYESSSDLSSAASSAESDPDEVQHFRGKQDKAWDALLDPKAPVKEKKEKIKDKVRHLFKKDKGEEGEE
ncbi:hypothetical protein Q8F55_005975 [Vanrija albida]|uniref:C2 domain-containing protein n=1 Tax=Vanrija albida TaxID=181172 RepID=A0ABR3Q3B8_9TREE